MINAAQCRIILAGLGFLLAARSAAVAAFPTLEGLKVMAGQEGEKAPPQAAAAAVDPARETMKRMSRPVAIDIKEQRLEDVMRFIKEATQADIEVLWADDKHAEGLDREAVVSAKVEKGTALQLLEKVLSALPPDSPASSWQVADIGALQVGPKMRLNAFKTVKLYVVSDLLAQTPSYADAPELDLQAVLQRQNGGGSQSPFRQNNDAQPKKKTLEERAEEIRALIMDIIETDQWADRGGDGATIRFFRGAFIVNAPGYIHRQIATKPAKEKR
jgi:hypothetical protein